VSGSCRYEACDFDGDLQRNHPHFIARELLAFDCERRLNDERSMALAHFTLTSRGALDYVENCAGVPSRRIGVEVG